MWILMFSSGKAEVAELDLWKFGLSGTKMERKVKAVKKPQTCPKFGMWTTKVVIPS
jgi:hypothetical protein